VPAPARLEAQIVLGQLLIAPLLSRQPMSEVVAVHRWSVLTLLSNNLVAQRRIQRRHSRFHLCLYPGGVGGWLGPTTTNASTAVACSKPSTSTRHS
jgi:hypothetical protein